MYSLQKYSVLLVFALISGIFFSCNRIKSAENLLPEPVFRAVLVDAFMAESYVLDQSVNKNFNASTLMNHKIYPLIWKKQGVDSEQFVHTFDYYLHRPDEFGIVLNKVLDTLNVIASKAPISNDEVVKQPDTAGPIESDSALAEDAMNRIRFLHEEKKQRIQSNKKTN